MRSIIYKIKTVVNILEKNIIVDKHSIKYISIGILTSILIILTITFGTSMNTDAGEVEVSHKYKYFTIIEVGEGESLWTIAKEYLPEGYSINEYINELRQMNSLSSDKIYSGSELCITYYSNIYKE